MWSRAKRSGFHVHLHMARRKQTTLPKENPRRLGIPVEGAAACSLPSIFARAPTGGELATNANWMMSNPRVRLVCLLVFLFLEKHTYYPIERINPPTRRNHPLIGMVFFGFTLQFIQLTLVWMVPIMGSRVTKRKHVWQPNQNFGQNPSQRLNGIHPSSPPHLDAMLQTQVPKTPTP